MAHVRGGTRRIRWRRLILLVAGWCAVTGGVFSGCRGLFTPAIPEPPRGNPVVNHYETVEKTLATMELGIAAKAQGSSAWLGAFDPTDYHQVFDDRDLTAFKSACQCSGPADWTLQQEQAFYLAFIQVRPADEYTAVFFPLDWNPDPQAGSSETLLHRGYRVVAHPQSGNDSLIIATGTADLTFGLRSDGTWLIKKWADRLDSTVGVNPTNQDQLSFGRRRLESTQ
jgi:hypothetical protein